MPTHFSHKGFYAINFWEEGDGRVSVALGGAKKTSHASMNDAINSLVNEIAKRAREELTNITSTKKLVVQRTHVEPPKLPNPLGMKKTRGT